MLCLSLDALLKLSKTTYPQNLFDFYCVTLYLIFLRQLHRPCTGSELRALTALVYLQSKQGVYIFLPGGGGQNMSNWLVGGKYDDLSGKSTYIRGKRWKNGGKEETFTVPRGNKYNFWK